VLKQFSEVFFRINQKVLVSLNGLITVILPDRDVPLGVIVPGAEIALWREGASYCAGLRRDMDVAKTSSEGLRPGSM